MLYLCWFQIFPTFKSLFCLCVSRQKSTFISLKPFVVSKIWFNLKVYDNAAKIRTNNNKHFFYKLDRSTEWIIKTQIQWHSCSKPKLLLAVFPHKTAVSLPKQSWIISLLGKKAAVGAMMRSPSCLVYRRQGSFGSILSESYRNY